MDDPQARPKAVRRFSLADGMILVAAIAGGFAPIRWIEEDFDAWRFLVALVGNFAWKMDLFDQVVEVQLILATPTAMTLTLAMLALGLRQPRPRWRLLARRPGMVACLAVLLGWAAATAFTVVNVLSISRGMLTPPGVAPYASQPINWYMTFALSSSVLAGFAVAVAWSTQAVVGRWRAEPTWVDRLGRLAGLGWIVIALAGLAAIRTITN